MSDTVFASLMNATFDIYRGTRVANTTGGFKKSFAKVATIRGRLSSKNNKTQEPVIAGRQGNAIEHILFTFTGENIQRDDVVVPVIPKITKNFRVIGIVEPSLMGHHWEINCEELATYSIPTT